MAGKTFVVPNKKTTKVDPKLAKVSENDHLESELTTFLGDYDPNDPNTIFALEPSRGVPDVFELGKFVKCTFVPESQENTLSWGESGQWKFGQGRIAVNVNGVEYVIPADAPQISAIFKTHLEESATPPFYAYASMQERKPREGVARSPLKVVKFYSVASLAPGNYITFEKSSDGKVDENFTVKGW